MYTSGNSMAQDEGWPQTMLYSMQCKCKRGNGTNIYILQALAKSVVGKVHLGCKVQHNCFGTCGSVFKVLNVPKLKSAYSIYHPEC